MSKPPSVQLEWTDSQREIERAKEKNEKPQRIARIRIRCWLANREKPYRFRRSLGPIPKTEAERVRATIADTLARLDRGNGVELPSNLTPDSFFEFLKTGGKEKRRANLSTKTLSEVIDDYFDHLPDDAKAAGSLYTERIHHKHLLKIVGKQTVFADIG